MRVRECRKSMGREHVSCLQDPRAKLSANLSKKLVRISPRKTDILVWEPGLNMCLELAECTIHWKRVSASGDEE